MTSKIIYEKSMAWSENDEVKTGCIVYCILYQVGDENLTPTHTLPILQPYSKGWHDLGKYLSTSWIGYRWSEGTTPIAICRIVQHSNNRRNC